MKKVTIMITLSLTVLMLAILTMPAMAVDITVDGDISDWGLSGLQTGAWDAANTWIPTIGGISFFVEDNQDPQNVLAVNYDPLYTGVHIYGNKDFQGIYSEEYLGSEPFTEPYGGEGFDIEAMYVTESDTHIFTLIVFSMDVREDIPFYMGDLALDFGPGGGYGYERGVNFHVRAEDGFNGQLYGIYATPNENCWTIPTPFGQNRPAEIDFSIVDETADVLGFAAVNYADLGKKDHDQDNWVVEVGIPKTAIGTDLPDDPVEAIRRFWITENCGNDSGPSIPEFLSIAIPVGMLVGMFMVLRRKRERR